MEELKLDLDNVLIEKDIVENFVDELGIKLTVILDKNINLESGDFNEDVFKELSGIRIKKALILEKKR
ncbi:MAG: hypothetical protein ACRC41_05890 [Sarcina sp.]